MTKKKPKKKAPGRYNREGISLFKLMELFPTERAAYKWFESIFWPNGRVCPKCGSTRTHEASHNNMPYRCRDCRGYFHLTTGTLMENTKLPLRKWAFAIYLEMTSLKGISSMKLHRELGISQKSAWFMLHRIRAGLIPKNIKLFKHEVEVDETYMGGKKKPHIKGRGPVGKTIVVGVKERGTKKIRAAVVPNTKKTTLIPFIQGNVVPGATVYTDDFASYINIPFPHFAVKHSVGEYVRDNAHTNGIESFWSMLKRAFHGTYHWFSAKHMDRYVEQFVAKHNMRNMDTLDLMENSAAGMAGRRLKYVELIA